MAPYSRAVEVGIAQPPVAAAPTGNFQKKLRLSESSSSFSGVDGTASTTCASPSRKIDRWQQLRGMMHLLTGLSDSENHHPTRRRRSCGSSRILLLHHDFWLEALDTKHRYGFHLRAFHNAWKQDMATSKDDGAQSDDQEERNNRSFFYWLDNGRGRDTQLPVCDRTALDATRVLYCSPQQRLQYQVGFSTSHHQLEYTDSHAAVQTDDLSKWIFVLAQDDTLYVARKRKGRFHHSSFLAGVPIIAAGKIFVADGQIRAIEPHSGHFKPKLGSLLALCRVLHGQGVDTDTVQFIKPKKWKDPWPFATTELNSQQADERDDQGSVSDSEDS